MKRNKTACKNKPHLWEKVMRKIEIWPFEVERFQRCTRCGRTKKGVIV